MINVGIIGCGSITRFRHAPEYKKNPNCNIAAFCDPVLARAEEMSSIFGGQAYDDYKAIINNPLIDAISVCSSNSTHAQITIEALRAGKHVLCEKPMAINTEQAGMMIKTARECGKYLMVGHNQRLVPAHMKAKEILKSGEIGRIISFKAAFKHKGPESWSTDKSRNTWFFKKGSAYLGVLGDLGIHKIDLIRWLLGEDITEVNAAVATLDKKDNEGNLIEVEDNAIGILKTSEGKIGSLEVSWTNYGFEDNSTVLYGEKGVMKIFSHPDYDIIIEMDNGNTVYYKTGGISTNTNQMDSGIIAEFVDCIVNNRYPEISGVEGYKALATVEAFLESSNTRQWVQVKRI